MSKVCDSVSKLIEPIVAELGMEIIEIEYKKQYNEMNLTVYIDKDGGVSLDDCETVHNAIDAPLDELDPTGGERYILNVSSAGLDRPLKTDRDFERKTGTEVEISLYAAINGKKKFEGVLNFYDGESVGIALEGADIKFFRKDIAAVKPVVRF